MFDVLIVGGGLAGLSLACALRDTRLKIALLESSPPQPSAGWDARVYAISPANAEFLQAIGVWKHLDGERISPIAAMKIVGDSGAKLDFSAYETGVAELGWVLESSLMACELWENVKRQANLTLLCPAAPNAIKMGEKSVELSLAEGQSLSTKLLVGADGGDSWVREAAGLQAIATPYGEMGLVANFECEHPHRGIARQWFRDDGVLAWLPLPGNRISVVWSTPDVHAGELLALPAEALALRVASAGGDALGSLKLLTPASAFPLRLLRVPQTIGSRVALLGDAAHGIHPLTGHGVNLGFQDVRVLADVIRTARAVDDLGDVRLLSRYQRARREEVVVLQSMTDAMRKLFASKAPGLSPLRNLGLSLTDKLTPIKSMLIRYALER